MGVMNHWAAGCVGVVAAGLAFGGAHSAEAATVSLGGTAVGTAVDNDIDGTFDFMGTNLVGTQHGMGGISRLTGFFNTEQRVVLEFDLSSFAMGTVISNATLTMNYDSGIGTNGTYSFYGYSGDGVLSIADASETTHHLGTYVTGDISIDATTFVQSLLDARTSVDSFAGFVGRETVDGHHSNFIVGTDHQDAPPMLTVDLNQSHALVVPVPAAAWMGMSLLGALGVVRKLRRRVD